ncbi:MAG: PD40 domain-containing protein [Ekhidna sp.]|nr:PD40 domain-containing protein [Ekhidna sp.]
MKKLTFLLLFSLVFVSIVSAQPLWLRYSAISPDGSKIAFTYKGDIYIVDSDGGNATPLTIDDSYDYMPVWSPDGSSIAFASDRYGNFDIFLAKVDGSTLKRLTYHSSNDFPNLITTEGKVFFNSWRVDIYKYAQFPNSRMPELYSVPITGGRPTTELTTPSEAISMTRALDKIYYQDRKGYENAMRKHHQSSITRDIWVYDKNKEKHTQLSSFNGEDRNPVLSPDEQSLYYLSELSGSFNIHKMEIGNPSNINQLTSLKKHPIRNLTISEAGLMCFSYDGEIYTYKEGGDPQKVTININSIRMNLERETVPISSGITEMSMSSNGKEFVFVKRGEVFVSSVDGGTTKRITNTAEQERSVSFSPDGKSILYAGERNGSWNIYQTTLTYEDEEYFFSSTVTKEEVLVASEKAEFQPVYSPDGKMVAYLEDRTTLKVLYLDSKKTETILPAERNYSYSDGDIFYSWSPDSKWIASDMLKPNQWIGEIGVINIKTKEVKNITNSGYTQAAPRWSSDGSMIYWYSDRDGMKNHGSWGSEGDIYGAILNQEAYDAFQLSKEDKELAEKSEDEESEDKDEESDKPVTIEFDDLRKRVVRLTLHSSRLSDAVLSKDGETLFYLARFEKGADLWRTKLRTKETKLLTKLGAGNGGLLMSKDGKSIYVLADGGAMKIDPKSGDKKSLKFNGEMQLKKQQEYTYMFNHMWQQVKDKFYVKDLHNVDWEGYKVDYKRFLPHINNNYDFAEMMSELLGELNASHTGSGYRSGSSTADQTGSLGLFFDETFDGNGLKIAEVLKDGPSDKADLQISEGLIIEMIDGVKLSPLLNHNDLLNRKINERVRLSLYDPSNKQKKEVVVKPIGRGSEYNLLYERWVQNRKKEVLEASNGRIGYVHVRGMNNPSYRTVYEEVLGENYDKEAIIIDTRSNGGGWLHDDLATFLSGKEYIRMVPRGQDLGSEPQFKWTKPSVVLIGESNYSDAHMFPYAYKALGIGTTVGMPVPGTGTAVWWETQIDPTIYFGIPQVGMVDIYGDYLENKQLEPDVKIKNSFEMLVEGKDEQLRKAVQVLLQQKAVKPADATIDNVEGGK